MAKLKEEREQKRLLLDDRHQYLFQFVSDHLGLEKNEAEEAALDGNSVSGKKRAAS